MIFTIVLLILAGLSIAYLGYLLYKTWPQLRMVVPASAPDVRDSRKKKEIIRQRLERFGGTWLKSLNQKVLLPVGKASQGVVRRVAGKLTAAERAYQEKQLQSSSKDISQSTLTDWVNEGRELLKAGEFDRAEKKLIDVLGLDNKNVNAYEVLGQVYLKRKDFQLAEETFRFLAKLSKGDASVTAYLGEVLEARGQKEEAFAEYAKAIKLSSKNPRYLDFYITLAIALGKKTEAAEGLEKLKEGNPDNQKIATFAKEIEDLP